MYGCVFVPSTGYLYFYTITVGDYHILARPFSSPLRGISISTYHLNLFVKNLHGFRPLYGVSLFLQQERYGCTTDGMSFRPLYGVSLFLPFLVFPLKIQRKLSGLRCKRTNQIISCS